MVGFMFLEWTVRTVVVLMFVVGRTPKRLSDWL